MTKLITTSAICWTMLTVAVGQDAKSYYEQAMEKAQAGKLEEAIKLFDKSIELKPDEVVSWYNRGIAKNMLGLYEQALPDFEQTIKLYPGYKKGYLNRGTTKKHLTDYEGAIADYTYSIKLDPDYADAFYNRGLVYEMLSKRDSACADFNKALQLGLKNSQRKVDNCKEDSRDLIETHSILRLTKTADNDKYGFTSKKPIKVGAGPDGGPANQEAYLDLLRDPQGKSIKYERLGSCCEYESPNGLLGMAMLDIYKITYLDEDGKEKTAQLYMSFYDYEAPQILFGFKTIGQK